MSTLVVDGYEAVMRLAQERPDWLPAVRAALAEADRVLGSDFAGAWVLRELQRQHAVRTWYPNLRLLVGYGIVEKSGESVRQKQRAYYRMPDPAGVRRALARLDRTDRTATQEARRFSFAAIGHSGRRDLSSSAPDILEREFPSA